MASKPATAPVLCQLIRLVPAPDKRAPTPDGVYLEQFPVTTQAEADLAASLFYPEAPYAEADCPDQGLWMISLPADDVAVLEEAGSIELVAGPFLLEAEMP